MKRALILSLTLIFFLGLMGLSHPDASGELEGAEQEAGKKTGEKVPEVKKQEPAKAKDEEGPAVPVYPKPIERHSLDFHYGVSAIPDFIKDKMDNPQEFNISGQTFGLAYTYYGKGGIKGIFSGRFSLDWVDYESLPTFEDIGIEEFYSIIFTTTGIWTIFPSSPVNLHIGLGMGIGGGRLEGTTIEDDPEHKDFPYLLPFIHIPIGLNARIRNIIITAETGLRDIPYVHGSISYAFLKGEDFKIIREVKTLPPPPPTEGKVEGRVFDAATNTPLGEAIIEMKGTSLTNLSTDPATGAFATPGIKEGPAELIVSKDGYRKKLIKVTVTAGETVKAVRVGLNRAISLGKLLGKVTDEKGKPLAATISFSRKEVAPVQSDPQSGKYELMLPFGNITITASAEGYVPASKPATVSKEEVSVVDFLLEPKEKKAPPPLAVAKKPKVYIEKKKIVITETIRFETGKANILPASFSLLDEVANILVVNPQIKVLVEGHTDSVGSDSYNLRLSQARADSVMKYLLSAGISPERLKALGYGEARPIADNATKMGRAKNRRVEFTIIGQ
jgi:outer membrane protein OmpA-like peptidoglycan-associated protein